MNNNIILEFLEKYKNLDELCRQVLSSDRGVSEYIDEMSKESQGYRIAGWERDYKKLKKMRWIRNRLVHETDSFEDNLVSVEDIEWLHTFYCRIMECTDPFSLLFQSEKMRGKKAKRKSVPDICFSTENASLSPNEDALPSPNEDESLYSNEDLPDRDIIVAGVVLIVIGILGILFYFIIKIFLEM